MQTQTTGGAGLTGPGPAGAPARSSRRRTARRRRPRRASSAPEGLPPRAALRHASQRARGPASPGAVTAAPWAGSMPQSPANGSARAGVPVTAAVARGDLVERRAQAGAEGGHLLGRAHLGKGRDRLGVDAEGVLHVAARLGRQAGPAREHHRVGPQRVGAHPGPAARLGDLPARPAVRGRPRRGRSPMRRRARRSGSAPAPTCARRRRDRRGAARRRRRRAPGAPRGR